jgi:hypothetical protein
MRRRGLAGGHAATGHPRRGPVGSGRARVRARGGRGKPYCIGVGPSRPADARSGSLATATAVSAGSGRPAPGIAGRYARRIQRAPALGGHGRAGGQRGTVSHAAGADRLPGIAPACAVGDPRRLHSRQSLDPRDLLDRLRLHPLRQCRPPLLRQLRHPGETGPERARLPAEACSPYDRPPRRGDRCPRAASRRARRDERQRALRRAQDRQRQARRPDPGSARLLSATRTAVSARRRPATAGHLPPRWPLSVRHVEHALGHRNPLAPLAASPQIARMVGRRSDPGAPPLRGREPDHAQRRLSRLDRPLGLAPGGKLGSVAGRGAR